MLRNRLGVMNAQEAPWYFHRIKIGMLSWQTSKSKQTIPKRRGNKIVDDVAGHHRVARNGYLNAISRSKGTRKCIKEAGWWGNCWVEREGLGGKWRRVDRIGKHGLRERSGRKSPQYFDLLVGFALQ